MRTKNKIATVLLSLALSFGVVMSADAGEWRKPLIPVTKDFTLPNGLRVVMSEDHSVPVTSVAIVYDVGARNEQKGKSGFAHLFEHMMFEGSENVGKTEHFKYIESAGGSLNASTHPDFTNYYDKIPSNQLELALWLESDRMRSLHVTEENFKNQLETVKEEKRSRIDNQPYTPATLRFGEVLFDNWANGHPVIGSFEDLEGSTVEDVRKFFKTYYAPNNAVMAIVGDFNADEVQKMVEKYFGSIPKQPEPPRPNVAETPQTKPKYEKVVDPHAQVPGFWIGWKAPGRREPDYYALGIVEKILSGGDSSRLYQRMVKGDKVALQASAGLDERRGPGAFEAFILYKPDHTADQVRTIFWDEIEKMQTKPVDPKEIETAQNQILRGLFAAGSHQSLQRSLGRAEMLAEYTAFFGDPKYIDEDLEAYLKVTPEDVQRVAKKYFTREGVTVLDVEPAGAKKASAEEALHAAQR
jgi:zinc protease